jgi:hypothetical protein
VVLASATLLYMGAHWNYQAQLHRLHGCEDRAWVRADAFNHAFNLLDDGVQVRDARLLDHAGPDAQAGACQHAYEDQPATALPTLRAARMLLASGVEHARP